MVKKIKQDNLREQPELCGGYFLIERSEKEVTFKQRAERQERTSQAQIWWQVLQEIARAKALWYKKIKM